ncbi:hypothetical protein [Burkholderia sp. S-53]|nr:hypothetical protein [Burkholderia sp. S-53]UXU85255.1 hypothetical protein LXM88_02400 [Burkholderia sp. S-53]UXU85283.1 hypothetical protein LXM88_02625 [Burkholderia sp. S-53]UXU86134.1 hypothetical protein LXM88_02335 [Burkholderia sp. S-53]
MTQSHWHLPTIEALAAQGKRVTTRFCRFTRTGVRGRAGIGSVKAD